MDNNTDNTNNTPETLTWTREDGSTVTGPSETMMRKFWESGKKGRLTAASPSAPARVEAAPVTPAEAPAEAPAAPCTVDPKKAQSIAAEEKRIRALGFSLPRPWFASGTRMLRSGVDTYRTHHRKWAKRPDAATAMEEVAAHIEAEDRRDFVVRLGDLHMDADGCLGRKGGPARPIEYGAWEKVYGALQAVDVLPDGAKLLRVLNPATRASVFNERIAAENPDKEVKIGVRRNAGGEWSIFRMVSPRYPTDGQAPVILRALAQKLRGRDYRGQVVYDPSSTTVRFDAAHMLDPVELDPTVGDIFRAGLKGSTNDAGMGRFRVDPFAGRIICVNCTMMDGYAEGYSRIHRGSMAEAIDAAAAVADKALAVFPAFAADWQAARDTRIDRVNWGRMGVGRKTAEKIQDTNSVPEALEAMVRAKIIGTGTHRDALVQHMLNAHKAEPGQGTVADLLNAVTRAAHESIFDQIQRDKLERQAGALLPVLVKTVRA